MVLTFVFSSHFRLLLGACKTIGFRCFYSVLAPYHERPCYLATDSEVLPYLWPWLKV